MLLQSQRCYLRKFEEKDALSFFKLNNDFEVLRYTGDKPFKDIGAALQFVKDYQKNYIGGMGRLAVCLKSNDAFIGWCGLKFHQKEKFIDLGYRFFRSEWNKGYATETATVCLNYGFDDLNLIKIVARARPENEASIRVMKKIGMSYLGQGIDHGVPIVVYQINNNNN